MEAEPEKFFETPHYEGWGYFIVHLAAYGSRFPDIDPDPIHTEACLYTNAPDELFILRRDGSIITGSACDGQGFQFAPDTGRLLACLALSEADAP